jgi:hypothetical protein
MDVTKDNLNEAIEDLLKHLPSCDFIAIDEEMTGIDIKGARNSRADTSNTRYLRMVDVASRFSVIQFGIALFTRKGSGYVSRPYNFFVFPEPGQGSQDVVLSAGAIEFLKKHNMNFQKWMYESCSFVNEKEENRLRAKYFPEDTDESPSKKKGKGPITLTRASDISFVEESIANLTLWMESDSKGDFAFPTCNSFLRRALREAVEVKNPDLILETRENFVLWAMNLSAEQKVQRDEEKALEKKLKFETKCGFRRVFSLLVDAKKPVVGHNCWFDLLFMYASFQGALPPSLGEFKSELALLFPVILDTKHIALLGGASYPSTALNDLHKATAEGEAEGQELSCTISPDARFERYTAENSDAYHEAAFDAHCTGCCLARMAEKNGGLQAVIRDAGGRINYMYGVYEFINLAPRSSDPTKAKGAVFVCTDLVVPEGGGRSTDTNDTISALFRPEFPEPTELKIQWLDNKTVLVEVVEVEAKMEEVVGEGRKVFLKRMDEDQEVDNKVEEVVGEAMGEGREAFLKRMDEDEEQEAAAMEEDGDKKEDGDEAGDDDADCLCDDAEDEDDDEEDDDDESGVASADTLRTKAQSLSAASPRTVQIWADFEAASLIRPSITTLAIDTKTAEPGMLKSLWTAVTSPFTAVTSPFAGVTSPFAHIWPAAKAGDKRKR